MKILAIDHVEFVVDDLDAASREFCEGYGFAVSFAETDSTAGTSSVVLGQGDIRLRLTTSDQPGNPVSNYLTRHGPGVAAVALRVPDAAATYAEVVSRGAIPVSAPRTGEWEGETVTTASVIAFGDVEHRLVSRRPRRDSSRNDENRKPGTLLEVDHLAVCVPAGDLAGVVARYHDVFGFDEIFDETIVVGGQAMESKVIRSSDGRLTVTLLEPDVSRDPGQIDRFLAAHDGAGVQHVAFRTADIAASVAARRAAGVRFLQSPASYYEALPGRIGELGLPVETLQELDVLADRDRWGLLFQIFTRSTHPRGTYFSELIERRGAKTFGSNNIKALYEAVQHSSEPVEA